MGGSYILHQEIKQVLHVSRYLSSPMLRNILNTGSVKLDDFFGLFCRTHFLEN